MHIHIQYIHSHTIYIYIYIYMYIYIYACANAKIRVEVRVISGRLPWLQGIKAGLLGGLSAIYAGRYYLNTGIEP